MPNVGSIFRIDVDDETARYFWCVGADASQLNSALITVFRRNYSHTDTPDISEIVSDSIDFYCHVFLLVGKKQGIWRKVGFHRVDRPIDMLFRGSNDYGNPSVRVSYRWYVWRPNEPYKAVGHLTPELAAAELGMVFPPDSVVERIRTGRYGIQHPTHDPALEPRA